MQEFLKKLLAQEHLTQDEAAAALEYLISPQATDAQIAAILIAMASKGETEEELAGFAQTMRAHCAKLTSSKFSSFIDTCGTGGSRAKTFNISTAAALIVSAAGVPVAKHGNVGVTTRAGSADVLRALGVETDNSLEAVKACFEENEICFLFAPNHHAATKRVALIRRELGVRTIFNSLGPLTNPAGAPLQMIGVSDLDAVDRLGQAVSLLGTQKTWVVHGHDGLDEVTLADRTTVCEITRDKRHCFVVAPEDFGLARASLDGLRGGNAAENAALTLAILRGERTDAALDLVLINAAAALHLAGRGETLRASAALARQAVLDGRAFQKLEQLIYFKHRVVEAPIERS